MKKTRLFPIIVTILFLTLFYSFVWAQETKERQLYLIERPPVALMILDLIIVRPISASVAIDSTGFCVGTMPLAFVSGVGEQSARVLVEAPWRFIGMRPLGDFGHYKDGKPITVVERP